MNRRDFALGSLAAASTVALGGVARRFAHAAVSPTKATIVLAHGSDHARVIESALDQSKALRSVRRGDTVLLKVNTNSGDKYPYSTSPEMIRCLGAKLADLGAKVVVGDRSFWGDSGTANNLEKNGIAAAARSVSAKVVAFEDDTVKWVAIPPTLVPHWRGTIRVPGLARDSDHVFNLPCVKTHFITTYTMALKNLLGLVHPRDRARPGNLRSHHPQRIYHQVAEIHRFVRCDWHILDGFRALVTGGPTPASGARPTIASPGIVAVSADPVAVDAVGIALLQTLSPKSERVTRQAAWSNPTLRAATAAGVGLGSPAGLTVTGNVPGLAKLRALAKS